jgi:hypothetical protein
LGSAARPGAHDPPLTRAQHTYHRPILEGKLAGWQDGAGHVGALAALAMVAAVDATELARQVACSSGCHACVGSGMTWAHASIRSAWDGFGQHGTA